MRPARSFPKEAHQQLQEALKRAKTKAAFQRIQCLWLRASLGLTADQVATAVGWEPASVRRLQAQYLKDGEKVLQAVGRGGRRNQNLTVVQERQLLRGCSAQGGTPDVNGIKRAYEQLIGHSVPKSTIYRMLARHGWRRTPAGRRGPRVGQERELP
ncbi:MAG: hypothetical protein AB1898_14180 [Acidobacteriota bacterium]